jgi:spermidine synthase
MLQARWDGDLSIVGVDDDVAVLGAATEIGWLPCDGLELVIGDAFEFVQTCHERFDYIAVDLFRGEDMVGRAFTKPFLRRLRTLLQPRGRLAINMFIDLRLPGRLGRIATFFDIRDQRAVRGNVIVHARRRR